MAKYNFHLTLILGRWVFQELRDGFHFISWLILSLSNTTQTHTDSCTFSVKEGKIFGCRKDWLTVSWSPWCVCHIISAATKPLQSCLTLCNPMDRSPPSSPVPGSLQARTLEWVAISFSNAWKWKVKVKLFSRVWLFTIPWTAAHQAPPSMEFSRQEYWSGGAIAFSADDL